MARGVVVIPDMMGIRPLFDDLCERLRRDHGWAVRAIETWPGNESLAMDERMARMHTRDDEQMLGEVAAAADRLHTEDGADRVAVIGFCMGGMYALKAAATGQYDRVVAFYGMIRLPEAWRGPGQREPLDLLAGGVPCPTLAIIGGVDTFTPPADVAAVEALGVEVVRYPEADHGFVHDPDRPAHRPDDAADAWRRVAEFLA